MQKNIFLHLLLVVLTIGCSGSKKTTEKDIIVPSAPNWVQNRPISTSYYVGIGIANKATHGENYQQVAKSNALNDIASDISVQVESNSFLTTIDHNYKFESDFKELIKTSTNQNLEAYELIDTYDDGTQYWCYYKLDKAKWESIENNRKKTAMDNATDFYLEAQKNESLNMYGSAIQHYIKSLLAIQKYWNQSNKAFINDKEIILDNSAFKNLVRLINEVSISPVTKKIELNYANAYKALLLFSTYNSSSQPLENIPVLVKYYQSKGKFDKTFNSNTSGKIDCLINEPSKLKPTQNIDYSLDLSSFINPKNKVEVNLIDALPKKEGSVLLETQNPLLYVSSSEKIEGVDNQSKLLLNAVQKKLNSKGVKTTNNSNEADLVLSIDGDTYKGQDFKNFKVDYVNYNITLMEKSSGKVISSSQESSIKGVALDHPKAQITAYENAIKNIATKGLSPILKILLD